MNDAMPSPAAQASAPVMTSAHALHFVFACRLARPDRAGAQAWIEQRLAPAAAVSSDGAAPAALWTAETLGTRPVWSQIGRTVVQQQLSPDLTPVVDRLLHGGDPAGPDRHGHGDDHTTPYTGFAPLAASRVDPAFGQVFEVLSNLTTRSAQMVLSANGIVGHGIVLSGSYTLSRSTDQSSSTGFGGAGGFCPARCAGAPNSWPGRQRQRRCRGFWCSLTTNASPRLTMPVCATSSRSAPRPGAGRSCSRWSQALPPASSSRPFWSWHFFSGAGFSDRRRGLRRPRGAGRGPPGHMPG